MTLAAAPDADCPDGPTEALCRLRFLRGRQAWTLMAVSVVSIAAGVASVIAVAGRPEAGVVAFLRAAGWQFAIWGGIDLVFAAMGVVQSLNAARTPPTPQAEINEFQAAEKLLKSLRFNHKLNVVWLLTAAALLIWAALARSPGLLGHGVGVGLQGGFLFVFDRVYDRRFTKLMTAPAE